ncbi:MAG: anthranilate phosphoribosyltransferase [Synergistales bacterium]|nr:anthranilate phosphoribosyltransferase [Synergistales bacterium]
MLQRQLEKIMTRVDLTDSEMAGAMEAIMDGTEAEAQVAAFLAGLRVKGETVAEIAGAARVMREKATPLCIRRSPLLDVVGTGGDMAGTFNISTAAALIAAAAGVAVAKHGNRSVSSRCGSADVLEALGIPLLGSPEDVAASVETTGFGFLFAPFFHSAMKNVVPVRKALGLRTVFNVLGPLTNPARPDCQLMGVFASELVRTMAEVLGRLGVERAMVVHGHGGLDELSLSGANRVCMLDGGAVREMELHPGDVGLPGAEPGFAAGGTADDNRRIVEAVFRGERGPRRDVVVLNAAAALYTARRVDSLEKGARMAEEVIDSGLAAARVRTVAAFAAARQEGAA